MSEIDACLLLLFPVLLMVLQLLPIPLYASAVDAAAAVVVAFAFVAAIVVVAAAVVTTAAGGGVSAGASRLSLSIRSS